MRCSCFLVGFFILRGTSVFYPVVMFCFYGVRVFIGFGILHEGCGFWRQERIVTVAKVVKTTLTGTGEVCFFMALFYNTEVIFACWSFREWHSWCGVRWYATVIGLDSRIFPPRILEVFARDKQNLHHLVRHDRLLFVHTKVKEVTCAILEKERMQCSCIFARCHQNIKP